MELLKENLLPEYLQFLQFECGLSPLTRENYARDIAQLIKLAETTALNDLQIIHIRRFIATLHSKGLGHRAHAFQLARIL